MKKLSNFILTIILGVILSLFLPWWAVMLAAFLSGAIVRLRNVAAFFVPFGAIALLWIVNAWMLSNANDYTLASKIAVLLPLEGNVVLLILVTGVIGGLAAGVAGLFGNQCRAIMAKED
ncbi:MULTISPECIES: hypothetical protein [Roseivirga]|uniref:hypothetical protein n=1 Tax=Roseivirga TaxID=290180 RepID=UPI001B12042B|nr:MULTISPECIES: hypothetical protein [Roseivirga]MBO6660511.1 hypothetical protein [Roseivirga sp.]MBO6760084.1 hypothetical protein [Roseivirga sp.]MBO6906752.1 hypothetical protein [Roseivirga sp.]WPZ09157.1 hypothetical protein T7867_12910 [Roseivirga spongicola]